MENIKVENLASYEYLKKIDIDPRLRNSFIRVMLKIQSYLDANGFTIKNGIDFTEMFEKLLICGNSKSDDITVPVSKNADINK